MSDKVDRASAIYEQKALGGKQAAPATKSEKEQSKAAADFSRTKDGGKQSMRVKIYSPFRIYYDGQASSISAVNDTGSFDILPKHHNFISLLSPCDLTIRTTTIGEQKVTISGGVMHVKDDQTIVFLDV